jgi:hypothetical protein
MSQDIPGRPRIFQGVRFPDDEPLGIQAKKVPIEPVDRHGAAIQDPSHTPPGGTFLRCGLLYRRGQCAADRLCSAAAADAAEIIRDMCLRSGEGFPDVLVVDRDPKFTSDVFRAFAKGMGSSPIVGSAYHKNTQATSERGNGVISDLLRAFANAPCSPSSMRPPPWVTGSRPCSSTGGASAPAAVRPSRRRRPGRDTGGIRPADAHR